MNTRTQLRSFCYFCGEHTAVTNGVLADHGYRVPGFGHRTSGCPGSHCLPVEQSTVQIEKSIRINRQYIASAPEKIANLIASDLKPFVKNSEVARVERGVMSAQANIPMDEQALANWTAKELIEVDLVIEAAEKKTAVTNTRRASLEAKLAKVPARKERAYKHFQKQLTIWANDPTAESYQRMQISCLKSYEEELGRIQREESEWNTKLSFMN